jgi:predicted ATPase
VLRRLDDLAPSQRRVVDAAAILGRRISFDLLAAVTGSGETSSSPSCASWWPRM